MEERVEAFKQFFEDATKSSESNIRTIAQLCDGIAIEGDRKDKSLAKTLKMMNQLISAALEGGEMEKAMEAFYFAFVVEARNMPGSDSLSAAFHTFAQLFLVVFKKAFPDEIQKDVFHEKSVTMDMAPSMAALSETRSTRGELEAKREVVEIPTDEPATEEDQRSTPGIVEHVEHENTPHITSRRATVKKVPTPVNTTENTAPENSLSPKAFVRRRSTRLQSQPIDKSNEVEHDEGEEAVAKKKAKSSMTRNRSEPVKSGDHGETGGRVVCTVCHRQYSSPKSLRAHISHYHKKEGVPIMKHRSDMSQMFEMAFDDVDLHNLGRPAAPFTNNKK